MKTLRETSAGGVVVRPAGGGWEVLLASRRTRAGDLVWGLPKGLVEPEEESEAAALREVREETGWEATLREPLGEITYWYVWGGERVHKVVRFFLMDAAREVGGRDEEMEEIAWFPLAEAPGAAAYDSEGDVIERAARALGVPLE